MNSEHDHTNDEARDSTTTSSSDVICCCGCGGIATRSAHRCSISGKNMLAICIPEGYIGEERFCSSAPCRTCFAKSAIVKARARRILDDDDDDFEDQDIGVPDLAIKKKSKKSKIIGTTTSAKVSKHIAFPTMPDWMTASAATIYDCMAIGRTNSSTLKPDWVRKFENPSWGHIVPRVIKELKEKATFDLSIKDGLGDTVSTTVPGRAEQRKFFSALDEPGKEHALQVLRHLMTKHTSSSTRTVEEEVPPDDLIARVAMVCVTPECMEILSVIFGGCTHEQKRLAIIMWSVACADELFYLIGSY